PLL
ncbi:hypothetical protein CFC21_057694, partial [Triticum aestivum]